jgi:hypothetical protein
MALESAESTTESRIVVVEFAQSTYRSPLIDGSNWIDVRRNK